MRSYRLGGTLLLATVLGASAQVTVEVTQEQNQFLQGEAIPVAVRITNRSGQTLHLGGTEDWLNFTIEGEAGSPVAKTGDVPVKGEFELDSSMAAVKKANLAPYFAPMQPGHYGITAEVLITDWNRQVSSAKKYFDVIEGAKLWEQEVGVPSEEASGSPELRRYILQQATYLRGQIRLYLRVTDSYGKTYRVFPIGQMISFGRPEPQVDKFSHLHVLYQNGPGIFSYTAFDTEGTLLARQTFEYGTTRPRLRLDEDGIVFVQGGSRRLSPTDVPPSTAEDGLNPVISTNQASTNQAEAVKPESSGKPAEKAKRRSKGK